MIDCEFASSVIGVLVGIDFAIEEAASRAENEIMIDWFIHGAEVKYQRLPTIDGP